MLSKFRLVDPVIVLGSAISILVAVYLVIIGQDKAISMLIGLVVSCITLIIDLFMKLKERDKGFLEALQTNNRDTNTNFNDRVDKVIKTFEENNDRVVAMFMFGDALSRDQMLFALFQEMIEDCNEIKQAHSNVFGQIMYDVLGDCRGRIHNLAEGFLEISVHSQYSFRRRWVHSVQSNMKLVQFDDPEYWRDSFGQNYMQLNKEAIERNVSITRIWIQTRQILIDYRDIIIAQKNIGINVRVIERDLMPEEIFRDYGVIDSKMLVYPIPIRNNAPMRERISINQVEVAKAEKDFEWLENRSTDAIAYYERLKMP